MKRTLLIICSICLVLAGIFGLFSGVVGINDAQNLQDYKTEDSEQGLAAVDTLLDGIAQLRANEAAYAEGVSAYESGLSDYYAGQSTLNAGYKAYNEGKKQIEENTAAYNEGKEMLSKIEPLMPYLQQYVEFRDGTIAKLPGFDNAQAWFVSVVRPLAKNLGLDIPQNVTDFPAYIQQMVADGQAQLKVYEDGLAQLEAAEKQLAQGERDLAAGGKQLEEGKNQLAEYENGEAQIAAGLETLLSEEVNVTGLYRFDEQTSDEIACPSIKDILQGRYGEDWTYWLTDENGEVVVVNGCRYLDLDACEQAALAAQDYINAYQGDPNITGDTIDRIFYCIGHSNGNITYNHLGHEVTLPCSQDETVIKEVIARYVVSVLELVTSILAMAAGIFGIIYSVRKSGISGAVCGWTTFGFGLASAVFGFCTQFDAYIYPIALYSGGERTGYEFSSHAQVWAVILLCVFALLFSLVLRSFKKHAVSDEALADVSEESERVLAEDTDTVKK